MKLTAPRSAADAGGSTCKSAAECQDLFEEVCVKTELRRGEGPRVACWEAARESAWPPVALWTET